MARQKTNYKGIFFLIPLLIVLVVIRPNTALAYCAHTADEAIGWVQSKVGTSVGYDDGSGQYQCVELIQAYYQYLGFHAVRGSGYQYATNEIPGTWVRTRGGTPQKGDILVYGATSSSPYGHVAIYEGDYVTYHQNYAGKYYVVKVTNLAYNSSKIGSYWGCIHPDFIPSGTGGSNPAQPSVNYVTIPNGTYTLEPALSNDLRLAIQDGKTETWGNLCVRKKTDAEDQAFVIINDGNEYHAISNKSANLYLDVENFGTASGTNVQCICFNDSNAQWWRVADAGNGYYYIISKCNGLYLDVASGAGTDGTNVWVYTANQTNAQKWKIIEYKPLIKSTFDANGGEGEVPSPIIGRIDVFPSGDTLHREGYVFSGWGDAPTNPGLIFQAGTETGGMTPTRDEVWYAVWKVHEWEPVTYGWNEDKTKCSALRTCKCSGEKHVDGASAVSITNKTLAATCEKDGAITYTAVFDKPWAATQEVSDKIPATGHKWSTQWIIDKAASETETGVKSHHCTVCDEKKDITTIPKNGAEQSTPTEVGDEDVSENEVTEIKAYAYKNYKSGTSVILPSTVKRINANAFAKSKITTVKLTIKKGLKLSVDKKAFKNSKVKKVIVAMSKKATKKEKDSVIKAFTRAGIKKKNIKIKLV